MCKRVSEKLRKLWPTAAFKPATSSFRTAMTLHTRIIQDINDDSADLNSARDGQFQENENNNFEYFPFKFFFRRKITSAVALRYFPSMGCKKNRTHTKSLPKRNPLLTGKS